MLNLIKEQNDIDKIYLYAKDFSEVLIEKRKDVGIKHLNDPNAFIECSNSIEINIKIELQNIATNHSADIDCDGFLKIYRECTEEPYSFLTIDTTLPASNPLKFRKINCFLLVKMTVTDQFKIIDNKIKENQAQYDLYRFAAKISALCFGELRKYEHLTSENVEYQPSVLEQKIILH